MSIQRLIPSHAAAYRALMLEANERHPDAFRSSAAERGALPLTWWEERLVDAPAPVEVVFGAYEEGQLVGSVGLRFASGEKSRHRATLFGMYVRPAFRGRGIGRRLVEEALRFAGECPGVFIVGLTVTEHNREARRLYASFGFEAFGVEPYALAVGDGFVAKVHLWCDLRKREG